MSTGFTQLAASSGTVQPDPSKHVNYTLGMLLGVDDFNQEFAYLAGRDQWMARDLEGYGTINGLKVSLQTTTDEVRLSVSSGTALSPRGQMICVHPDQCTFLNKWLSANQTEVSKNVQGSPPGSLLKLWLVVCYRDCPVDPVPIAGEPCRSADDLMANSRIVDDFLLDLRFAPPQQQEEEAVRDFVNWLDQIQITDGAGSFPTLAQFEDALRAAFLPITSPVDAGTFFHMGSPLNQINVHPNDAGTYLRSAFRIWVTEIRPIFHSCWPNQSCSCDGVSPKAPIDDECLLLAELDVPLVSEGPGWKVDDKHTLQIDESHRPILLHSRMLQEWMQSGLRGGK